MYVCVCVLTLTSHVHGSPAARSCLEERAPSWLSGDSCARRLCHTINLHNGGYIYSRGSQTDLEDNSVLSQYLSTTRCHILPVFLVHLLV